MATSPEEAARQRRRLAEQRARIQPRRGSTPRWIPVALIASLLGAFAGGAYLYETGGTLPSMSRSDTPATSAPDGNGDMAAAERVGTSGEIAPDEATPGDDVDPSAPAGDRPDAAPAGTGAEPDPAALPESRDRARTQQPTATPAPSDESSARTPAPRSTATGDLSGVWTLTTEVESSSLESFEGLRLGYRVELRHNGDRVTGNGRKVSENGRPIASGGQTPIVVQGTAAGEWLTLSFTERGARRQSSGRLVLKRNAGGVLRGSFSTDAARSRGSVEARRQ